LTAYVCRGQDQNAIDVLKLTSDRPLVFKLAVYDVTNKGW